MGFFKKKLSNPAKTFKEGFSTYIDTVSAPGQVLWNSGDKSFGERITGEKNDVGQTVLKVGSGGIIEGLKEPQMGTEAQDATKTLAEEQQAKADAINPERPTYTGNFYTSQEFKPLNNFNSKEYEQAKAYNIPQAAIEQLNRDKNARSTNRLAGQGTIEDKLARTKNNTINRVQSTANDSNDVLAGIIQAGANENDAMTDLALQGEQQKMQQEQLNRQMLSDSLGKMSNFEDRKQNIDEANRKDAFSTNENARLMDYKIASDNNNNAYNINEGNRKYDFNVGADAKDSEFKYNKDEPFRDQMLRKNMLEQAAMGNENMAIQLAQERMLANLNAKQGERANRWNFGSSIIGSAGNIAAAAAM